MPWQAVLWLASWLSVSHPLLQNFTYQVSWAATLLTGIQLFMVIYGFSVLLETPPSKRQGRLPYMFISLTLFALPTIAALVLFHRYFNIWRDMNGPLDYFPRRKTQGVWATYLNNALYCVTILLGDGLLLFRCYIIWADRLWVLVLPALLFISSVGK